MGQTVPCPTCEQSFTLFPNIAIPSAQITVAPTPTQKPIDQKTVPCPTCEKSFTLFPDIVIPSTKVTAAPAPTQKPMEQKRGRSNLSKLTEETIRARTKAGDTPLHRAARNGQFGEIPSRLLSLEMFMVKNNAGETPLHVAAKHGHLDQVPRQFLTKETLITTASYFNGSVYVARNNTVLHDAAHYCADQIPKEFLTPEFLSIDAGGYGNTVLHSLADAGRLDSVPKSFTDWGMWKLKNSLGITPREIPKWKAQKAAAQAEREAWRPPRLTLPIQNEPSKLLPVFSDDVLRAIEIQSTDRTKTYIVNLLEYTCTCQKCLEIHSGVPARDFGRLCKHIIMALRGYNLVAKLPPIARGIAENGYPDAAFGVYPGRFGNDRNGNSIYITGKNQDGWISVIALAQRNGVNYFRFGFNVISKRWYRALWLGDFSRKKPPVDESILY